MRKFWDNSGLSDARHMRQARLQPVPATSPNRHCHHLPRHGPRAHGRRHRHRLPPLHPQPRRMRPDHDRVHLGRRRPAQKRSESQALSPFLRRRAPHLRAAFRQRSAGDGRGGPHGRRPGLRPGRSQPGMSREKSREVQRRLRPSARSACDRQDFRSRARSREDSLHGEIPRRME